MTPLEKLEQAIEKKHRHTKRRACSAGIDEIRKAFAEYKKSLETSWWKRFLKGTP